MANVPSSVEWVLDGLWSEGYEAYLVGGCVRDQFLHREVNDWDVTTSALPEQVEACFPKVIPTGIAHGTVSVIVEGEAVEVTTYRVDGVYSDGRRPESVTFTPCLKEDLARRDFTINAMALNPREGTLVDPFDGRRDLDRNLIRAVGVAFDRLSEDGLRAFRAARFASQLGFSVDDDLLKAMTDTRHVFAQVSVERMFVELSKTLCSPRPSVGLSILSRTGLMDVLIADGVDDERSFTEIDELPTVLWVRLALFLYLRNVDVERVSRRLKFPKVLKGRLKRAHDLLTQATRLDRIDFCRDLSLIGREDWEGWMALCKSARPERWHEYREVEAQLPDGFIGNCPLSIRELAVSGKDLMAALEMRPSRALGDLLTRLLEAVWSGRAMNDIDSLMGAASDLKA